MDLYVRDAVWPSVALKKLVDDQVTITEQDIQSGFEANYGERVEVLAIVMQNQRIAQRVWQWPPSLPRMNTLANWPRNTPKNQPPKRIMVASRQSQDTVAAHNWKTKPSGFKREKSQA